MQIQTLSFFSYIPKSVLVAIGIALFINVSGLTFIFAHASPEILIYGDAVGYRELAQNIHEGRGFGQDTDDGFVLETFRMPGLPFLYSLFLDAGLGLKTYFYFISILSAIAIPLLSWYIAKELFSNEIGNITAVLIAIEPILWLHNWTLLTEVPFLIVCLSACALLVHVYRQKIVFSYVGLGAGILFACAVYIRPAAFPLLLLAVGVLLLDGVITKQKILWPLLFTCIIMFMCLVPWYERMHEITGVYALSGTGWRNVYTDYLASIRAINNNTRFVDEKEQLKQYAMQTWNLQRFDINSPQYSTLLKNYAIPEILQNKTTVIKLQSILFISYFTHSDYQRRLQKVGLLPANIVEEGRVSSSRLIISKGIGAVPFIYAEMKNRYFLPIIERVWTMGLLFFALLGVYASKKRIRFLLFALIGFGYLTSSAIGLGVEGRLRLPILPFYFMLASCGILFVFTKYNLRTRIWKK